MRIPRAPMKWPIDVRGVSFTPNAVPVGVASYFCMANAAALVATFKFLGGRRYAVWEKSATSR